MTGKNGNQKDEIKASALELIGNTPIVALDRIHRGPGRILAKCEFMNPGGSIKCRSSLFMINEALESGLIKPGDPILEVTSGNQGCGLAVVCAVLGHPLTVFMSAGNSIQRAIHIEALGAKCVRVPQVQGEYGKVTLADVNAAGKACHSAAHRTRGHIVNQISNPANSRSHFATTGPEIWRQTGGRVDAFVAAVGTAGTYDGATRYLKQKNVSLKAYVVEPKGSEPVGGKRVTKPMHLLQGAGYGGVPCLLKMKYVDGTISVSDEEALRYQALIGAKEGLFVGYTSAANVAAAIKLLRSGALPDYAWVVTVLPDTGLKYL